MTDPAPSTTLRDGAARRQKYWLKGNPADHLPVIYVNGHMNALRGRRGCKTAEEATAKAQRRIDEILREIRAAGR